MAAVDSAPLVSFAWLLRSASMAELPALVIWSLLRCSGPSISHVARALDAGGHLFDQRRAALDELADDERQDAADDRDSAEQHQRHRAAAGSAAAIQEVDRRDINAASISAKATGTTMTSSRVTTQSNATTSAKITSSRHDQAAALRMTGGTASSCDRSDRAAACR